VATVTGLTADRMEAIEAASVVSGTINGSGHLILTTHDGSTIDAGYVLGSVPDASETVKGLVELATTVEAAAGSDTIRAVTPAGLTAAVGTLVPDASSSVKGKVQLANSIEAIAGTNTTKAITPADLAAVLAAFLGTIYPIGSIYMSTSSTNPNTLFGVGTWAQIQGQFLMGQDGSHAAGSTGGALTKTLSTSEMPAHNHTATIASDAHTHNIGRDTDGGSGTTRFTVHNTGVSGATATSPTSSDSHTHGATIANTGGGAAFSILPPYVAVYIWKRTA